MTLGSSGFIERIRFLGAEEGAEVAGGVAGAIGGVAGAIGGMAGERGGRVGAGEVFFTETPEMGDTTIEPLPSSLVTEKVQCS